MPCANGEGNMLHLDQKQFDFNLQFESLFFSIMPSVLFISSSLWRTLARIRKPVVVNAPILQSVNIGAIVVYSAAIGPFHADGVALSGGQKQRLSLARALYLPSDFVILDVVFSGLDADTEEQVFRQVFGPDGRLQRRGSTVVLCTHSVRHLSTADYIIALENGSVAEQGTLSDLSSRAGYVQRLGVGQKRDSEGITADDETGPGPYPEHKGQPGADTNLESETTFNSTQVSTPVAPAAVTARYVGDATVYKLYIRSMGWFVAACSLFFAALWGLFANYPTIWLTYWSDATESNHPAHSNPYYAGIFAVLQICAIIALLLLGITLFHRLCEESWRQSTPPPQQNTSKSSKQSDYGTLSKNIQKKACGRGTLSAGQRQLFSLGRAVLRAKLRQRLTHSSSPHEGCTNEEQGGILLLDEVSSSVDRQTEQMMQEIIRTEFRAYTVIAVSHRLEMIMDFDRVVVLDRGEVVEVGNPVALTERGAESRFGELVVAAGA